MSAATFNPRRLVAKGIGAVMARRHGKNWTTSDLRLAILYAACMSDATFAAKAIKRRAPDLALAERAFALRLATEADPREVDDLFGGHWSADREPLPIWRRPALIGEALQLTRAEWLRHRFWSALPAGVTRAEADRIHEERKAKRRKAARHRAKYQADWVKAKRAASPKRETRQAAAARLGVSVRTLQNMLGDGRAIVVRGVICRLSVDTLSTVSVVDLEAAATVDAKSANAAENGSIPPKIVGDPMPNRVPPLSECNEDSSCLQKCADHFDAPDPAGEVAAGSDGTDARGTARRPAHPIVIRLNPTLQRFLVGLDDEPAKVRDPRWEGVEDFVTFAPLDEEAPEAPPGGRQLPAARILIPANAAARVTEWMTETARGYLSASAGADADTASTTLPKAPDGGEGSTAAPSPEDVIRARAAIRDRYRAMGTKLNRGR